MKKLKAEIFKKVLRYDPSNYKLLEAKLNCKEIFQNKKVLVLYPYPCKNNKP
jgi:hypothetical protein